MNIKPTDLKSLFDIVIDQLTDVDEHELARKTKELRNEIMEMMKKRYLHIVDLK